MNQNQRGTISYSPPVGANWLGLWTLYAREVRRFAKVYIQSVLAPIFSALIFMLIFTVALGRLRGEISGVPFTTFLAPGLVMMAIIQNAFGNASFSILIAKMQGNIVDTLMPPLSTRELVMGYMLGGVTRGLVVGVGTAIALGFFLPFPPANIWMILFHALAASAMLSLMGIIGGVWAEKNDALAVILSFVIVPLSLLSGTFYSIASLPPGFRVAARFNPFFYAIDGFRAGFIGQADSPPLHGILVMSAAVVILWILCHRMIASGYRLKG